MFQHPWGITHHDYQGSRFPYFIPSPFTVFASVLESFKEQSRHFLPQPHESQSFLWLTLLEFVPLQRSGENQPPPLRFALASGHVVISGFSNLLWPYSGNHPCGHISYRLRSWGSSLQSLGPHSWSLRLPGDRSGSRFYPANLKQQWLTPPLPLIVLSGKTVISVAWKKQEIPDHIQGFDPHVSPPLSS